MAVIAKDVLTRASTLLQDDSQDRWTLPEMLAHLNAALKQIALWKPTAYTETVEISLVEGTVQTLPDGYVSLVQITRNLTTISSDPAGKVGGKVPRVVDQRALDAQMPSWSDPNIAPFKKVVDNVTFDSSNPREFRVVPGNDGTGHLEAVVCRLPTQIEKPVNPFDMNSYNAEVDVPDIFEQAVVDFIVHRTLAGESAEPNSAARSVAFLNSFNAQVGVKTQTDATLNPNTKG